MHEQGSRIHLIWKFSKGARAAFAVVLLSSLASTVLGALIPRIFSYTIDDVLAEGAHAFAGWKLWLLSLLVAGIALADALAVFLYRTNVARAGETFVKNMRDALYAHVQRLAMSWHESQQTGDIIQRCTTDVETIRTFVATQLVEVCRTVFLLVISLIMMVTMNRKLTLIALSFTPVIILYSIVFFRLIQKNYLLADEAEGELSTVVQENATGVRVVRAFGRESFEIDRFDEKNNIFANLWIRVGTLSGIYWSIGDLITGFQVLLVVVLGAIESVNGGLTAGEFVAFASYNASLVWPIRALGRILSLMSRAGVSFDRVNYILDAAEEDPVTDGKIPENTDLEFDHVTFGYLEGQTVLKDISFRLEEGKILGILGGTGSGKSTLMEILERLYELEEGSIRIGGTDIREIPSGWLRSHVGIVLQEPFLFSRTIRENIAAARPDATMEEIEEAAGIACIHDEICRFPDGYDTMVGERGVTLSGGQRQRIAIARMLLMKAPVMIFDDSLSAVDMQTDAKIRAALKDRMRGATVILISHRVTTLMEADEILVINRGEIVQQGTHEKLVGEDGIYRRIYEIQISPE